MRLFECLLLLSVTMSLIYSLFVKKKSLLVNDVLVFFSFIFFIVHALAEGTRWQLAGVYILLAVFILCLRYHHLNKKNFESFTFPKYANIILCVLLILSMILLVIFPVYVMKKPDGMYQTGTRIYEATDENRIEIYGNEKDQFRKLKFQVWYPADHVENFQKTPWLYEGVEVAKGISKMLGFPLFTLNQTKYITTHSYLNAPLSQSEPDYPVVVISHGWNGFRSLHTDFAETLASHGFVVVSIDHTYGAAVTVFEDGTVRYNYGKALDGSLSPESFIASANILVDTYSKDILFVIDQLELLNQNDDAFKNSLDLTNIGLAGHSTGGGAAVLSAIRDDRIKSVFGLDSWVEPINLKEIESGLDVPSFFLRSEQWENSKNNENLFNLIDHSPMVLGLYQVTGTYHVDFSMSYVFSPISKLIGKSGSLKSKISIQLQNDLILDFFTQTLMNHDMNMTKTAKYGEYIIKIRGGE